MARPVTASCLGIGSAADRQAGRLLLTHQGRRVSADTLREELRRSLEAVAGKVRRHEETICRLRRAWREPRQ